VLYPTGSKQLERTPKFVQYFKQADVIAGDYLYIDKYMPEDLQGKIILTNTTTSENVEELKKRGVSLLITTTPVIEEEVLEPMFWRRFHCSAGQTWYPPHYPEYEKLIANLT